MVKEAKTSEDQTPNNNIPDEPLSRRWIYVPEPVSQDSIYVNGSEIRYYLSNVTEAHEYVERYVSSTDTSYPTGLLPAKNDIEYDPLFEEGYEPDEFWEASDGLECPVYGPFVGVVSDDGYFFLDVQNLVYENGKLGAVPKGYYDFVYRCDNQEAAGILELNLAATELSPASPDVIISRDVIVSPDIRYVTSPEIRYVTSREVEIRYIESPDASGKGDGEDLPIGIRSSSSSGCDSGFGLAGLILLSGLAAAMKKR